MIKKLWWEKEICDLPLPIKEAHFHIRAAGTRDAKAHGTCKLVLTQEGSHAPHLLVGIIDWKCYQHQSYHLWASSQKPDDPTIRILCNSGSQNSFKRFLKLHTSRLLEIKTAFTKKCVFQHDAQTKHTIIALLHGLHASTWWTNWTEKNQPTNELTNSSEPSPFCEDNSCSASQEIPCVLQNMKLINTNTTALSWSLSWARLICCAPSQLP
jgi:hypothetical protein